MIPVSDANRFIGALNRIAEGVTMLAAAIEETAWEDACNPFLNTHIIVTHMSRGNLLICKNNLQHL